LALLRFGEMCLEGGKILREKCQDLSEPVAFVSDLITEASLLATSAFGSSATLAVGPTVETGYTDMGRWSIPRHYVDRNILRGLFVEILHNALRYGSKDVAADGAKSVRVSVAIARQADGIRCTWANAVDTPRSSVRTGFLGRLEHTVNALGYMEFKAEPVDQNFVVRLDLLPVDAETEAGVLRRVAPVWVPIPRTT
jgi:hypothetical protein